MYFVCICAYTQRVIEGKRADKAGKSEKARGRIEGVDVI